MVHELIAKLLELQSFVPVMCTTYTSIGFPITVEVRELPNGDSYCMIDCIPDNDDWETW